jgi:uncharacterized cupredoxin-like copper-binding protein
MHKFFSFSIITVVLLLISNLLSACGEQIMTIYIASSKSDLQFNPSSVRSEILPRSIMRAYAGRVRVEISNRSASVSHRWVLIEGGDQEAATIVAAAATQPDYDLPSAVPVVAKTALLPPGRSQVLEFTVHPGSYIYVCTVPGHYQVGMKGSLFLTE